MYSSFVGSVLQFVPSKGEGGGDFCPRSTPWYKSEVVYIWHFESYFVDGFEQEHLWAVDVEKESGQLGALKDSDYYVCEGLFRRCSISDSHYVSREVWVDPVNQVRGEACFCHAHVEKCMEDVVEIPHGV